MYQPEHYGTSENFDEYLSSESAQWSRDDASVRADLLRRRQARIDERRQFGNPVSMDDLQRVMALWTALRPACATYEQVRPVRVCRTAWRDLAGAHAFTPCLETFMANWVADAVEARV